MARLRVLANRRACGVFAENVVSPNIIPSERKSVTGKNARLASFGRQSLKWTRRSNVLDMCRRQRGRTLSWPALRSISALLALAVELGMCAAWSQSTDSAALAPESAVLFQEGLAAQQNRDLLTVEKDYAFRLARFPDFLPAQFNLGLVFDREGRIREAIDQFLLCVIGS